MEIQVKKDLVDHTVGDLECSYYDEFVTVVWFARDNIRGEVSRLEVDQFHKRELPLRPTSTITYPESETLDQRSH